MTGAPVWVDRGRPIPDVLEQEESHDEVARLLGELEPDLREVLELCVIGGKSYREVAAITGASLGTVSARIHQGLSRIAGVVGIAIGSAGTALSFALLARFVGERAAEWAKSPFLIGLSVLALIVVGNVALRRIKRRLST